MSEKPFMQLYVSDFIGDTLSLSTEEVGAYFLILMAMWNAGGSLPDDDRKLSRVTRLSMKKWCALRPSLDGYFTPENGSISNGRLTREFQKATSKSESRASAGAKGGSAKALKDNNAHLANATVLPCHLPEPYSNNLTSDTNVSSVSVGSDEPTRAFEGMDKVPSSKPKRAKPAYSEAFEKFWGMYPKTPTMAKKEAWDVWRKMGDDDREDASKSMPAYVRYCRQNPDYPPIHACRFLSKRRWEPLLEAQPAVQIERKEEDDAEFRRKLAEQWEGSDEERELEELRRIQGDIPSGRPLRHVPTERVELHPSQNGSRQRPLPGDHAGDGGMASLGALFSKALQ